MCHCGCGAPNWTIEPIQGPSAEQVAYFRRYFGVSANEADPVIDIAISDALVAFKARYPKLDPLKSTHEVYSDALRRLDALSATRKQVGR